MYSVADRSQVSLIYSLVCSPSRIITASSTIHDRGHFRRRDRALPAGHGLDASASFTCEGNWNLYSCKRAPEGLDGSDLLTGGEWCHHGSVLVPSF